MKNADVKISDREREIYRAERSDEFYSLVPAVPKNLMVELSNACNHACIFCASPHMKRTIGRMNGQLVHRLMTEAHAEGVEEIGFYTTGDPFIHKDLARFTADARDIGFRYIYISTNGALATPDRAKAVIDAGMNSIKFSINAGSRKSYALVHGSDEFEKVLYHLRFISEYRQTLGRPLALFATFVVTDITAHEVEGFKTIVGPLVDEIFFSPCGFQSGQMSKANALLATGQSKLEGNAICPLPFNRLHVSCEGYLTLCCVDYQNYLAVADLNEMTLGEAWRCDAFPGGEGASLEAGSRRHSVRQLLAGPYRQCCAVGRASGFARNFQEFYDDSAAKTKSRLGE